MIEYHKTNGPHGEICIEWEGQFVGFIVNLGRADRWAAYDRQLKPLGEGYGSRAQAATACIHDCSGRKKIPIRDILEAALMTENEGDKANGTTPSKGKRRRELAE